MTKKIILHTGEIALIDDIDYNLISKFKKFYAHKSRHLIYASAYYRKNEKPSMILMHRIIMNPKKSQKIDHINGNGLDNRRCNLRICKMSENQWNRIGNIKATSKYKGVDWCKREKKWRARISSNYKVVYIGYFNCEIKAAKAYDNLAIKLHGKYARLNLRS